MMASSLTTAVLLTAALFGMVRRALSASATVSSCPALANALAGTANPVIIPSGVTINMADCPDLGIKVNRPVTIQGAGPGLSILNGGGRKYMFHFREQDSGANYNFTIRDLTMTNGWVNTAEGWTGGCLSTERRSVQGTVINVAFTNCQAVYGGAIQMSGGSLSVFDSTFTNNMATGTYDDVYGGAINSYNGGWDGALVVVVRCTFTNNGAASTGGIFAAQGGAIYADGHLVIIDSSFTGNYVFSNAYWAKGGALVTSSEKNLTVTGSTFTRNSARSSRSYAWAGALTAGYVSVASSVFTTNNVTSGLTTSINDLSAVGGAILARKVIFSTNCSFTSNLARGGSANAAVGGAVAIWSDLALVAIFKLSTFSSNSVTGSNALGGAISSNYYISVETSTFTGNIASSTITPSLGLSDVGRAMGGAFHSWHSDDDTRLHSFTDSMFDRNSADGTTSVKGGAIAVFTHTRISRSIFLSNFVTLRTGACPSTGCPTASAGGAVFHGYGQWKPGNLAIDSCSFTNNSATGIPFDGTGGAIAAAAGGGSANITGCSFTDNKAISNCTLRCSPLNGGGGAISTSMMLNVSQSTFTGNSHVSRGISNSAAGGAILVGDSRSYLNAQQCTFERNFATSVSAGQGRGGAILVASTSDTDTWIIGCSFTSNSASAMRAGGGAICMLSSPLRIADSSFMSNQATATESDAYGGAIDTHDSSDWAGIWTTTFTSNSVSSNAGVARGGAIAFGSVTTAPLNWGLGVMFCTFSANSALSPFAAGGALFIGKGNERFTARVGHSTFDGSTATGESALGGAIAVASDTPVGFCRGNLFGKTAKNTVQQIAGANASTNDLDAGGKLVKFCPSIPVYVEENSQFIPSLQCDHCDCSLGSNPCDPRATCIMSPDPQHPYCLCPTGTRGNGFTCGPVLACIP